MSSVYRSLRCWRGHTIPRIHSDGTDILTKGLRTAKSQMCTRQAGYILNASNYGVVRPQDCLLLIKWRDHCVTYESKQILVKWLLKKIVHYSALQLTMQSCMVHDISSASRWPKPAMMPLGRIYARIIQSAVLCVLCSSREENKAYVNSRKIVYV